MLRITVNKSSSGAKKYYSEMYYGEGNKQMNYYSEKDEAIGNWKGIAAEKLGLTGYIKKSDFASLCDNQIPGTNNKLTERNNAERRVGYDFTFNASKSVSLAYTFGTENDKKEILKAFQDSVKETMSEIETGVQTRVRQKGQNENRDTGNIAYGEFIHFTGRPVNNVPDPHLHAHCFVFNATYDTTEKKWKAGEFGQVKKDAPYYEAVFHASLAGKLQDLGYAVERTRNGFEINGISRETIEKFSLRTEEIEHLAKERHITDKEEKAKLGANTRESKRNSTTEPEQQKEWNKRLTHDEKQSLKNLKNAGLTNEKKKESSLVALDALDYSLKHHLERKSVTTDKEILTTAIKSSIGETTPEEIKKAFVKDSSIISVKENSQTFITTKEALMEENKMIAKAYDTKGRFKPLNENYLTKIPELTDEQKNAIRHALTNTDGISIIAGKAGTGKTTLMQEVQAGIKAAGKNIFAFAPSADASRGVQRKEGFENAETLAALIHHKSMQEQVKDSVIWIDEAGMISNKDMNRVLDIAKQQNARLILTGDTKQHSSVERGDSLRILQQEAGITSIQVNKILRQKNTDYREAVSLLAKSEVEKGFHKLDKMGAIHEITDDNERVKKIAADYVVSTHGKNSKQPAKEVLVVSPTHAEGERVTEQIRQNLRERQIIAPEERKFQTLKNVQLTAAEKQKTENYSPGNWIIFQQNAKGFKTGSRYEITGIEKNNVLVKDNTGKTRTISTTNAPRYNVFEPKQTGLSKGDKIRITANGHALDGKSLFNGTMYNIAGFDKQGNIKLSNGSAISKDYGQLTLGYVMTSHASQGKTVDKVIISQSSMSFRASSKEQFYVSVSRGRQAVSIYTDGKADLLQAVKQSGERLSARELTKKEKLLANVVEVNRMKFIRTVKEKAVNFIRKEINKIAGNGLQRSITAKETGRRK